MDEKKTLRKLSALFGVGEKDLPKTIERFKNETEEMEKYLKEGSKHAR